ncbi:hypothetical protein [Spiroplasma endosymbiont of Polydrusus pterygomalis]|uniref:hypothetical protein n=1 Tax=Spiroplasma endosymbiont of Polydrusus pterygomalis TaxID=3139327 RepID=UPI003CCB4B24
MPKEEKTYLLKEDEKQNYRYEEFIKNQFSSKIIEMQEPIYEASLIANSNFEVLKKQINHDNFNQRKVLELQEKLSKIKNNLKINKNKIIKNLKKQKKNKFINFIIKIFSMGKINKNKDIDNKISDIQTKWTEIKKIRKETKSNLNNLLKFILKNQEINSKEILNINQKNLKLQDENAKLQQKNSKFKTDFEQLNQSEQLLKTIILENKVDKARMQTQIEQQKTLIIELKQKIKMIKEEQIEQQKTLILEVDEQMVANYETQIFKLNEVVCDLESKFENKQAFINELKQKVKDNKMKIKELQEKLDKNEQVIIILHEENDAYKKVQKQHNEKYVNKFISLESMVRERDEKISFLTKENVLLEQKKLRDSGIESASGVFDSDIDNCKDKINAQKQEQQTDKKLTKSQISL